ncbi:MAG: GmrSD restriction endonuclease domain-containing protein, partial [Actinomycetales bacterium]
TGYDRDLFAYRGVDLDGNGCDTRNDVLRRDLTAVTLKPGTQDCVVLSGTLADPYSGTSIPFVRGESTSADVQVDHVVALSDAWQKGAQRWSAATRQAFANDSLNLLAVDGPTNEAKGDGDAATWLPPVRSYRCAYVARQVAVKARYGLWVTAAERDAIRAVLSGCPGQRLPAARPFVLGGGAAVAASTPAPQTVPAPAVTTGGGLDPRFGTCKEATAQGYGPYVRGRDPEYDWYQDRDHDGVVCE